MQQRSFIVAGTVVLAAITACRSSQHASSSVTRSEAPSSVATTHSAELTLSSAPVKSEGKVETVDVPSDRAALVVVGDGEKQRQPIVHIHGMCTTAQSDLEAWSSSVRAHGTIIALEGDKGCAGAAGGRTWSMDVAALDKRIDAAIEAVRTVRGVDLDAKEIILIGESMGASRAAALAGRSPDKYPRLVLVGVPEKISPRSVGSAKAVAVMVAEKEPPENANQTMEALTTAGANVKLWTLGGAIHGEYGPSGGPTMSDALAFVTR